MVVDVLRPIFPRYVFIPFASAWVVKHEVDGVVGLVSFGSRVAGVPGNVVDDLVFASDPGDVLSVEDAAAVESPTYRRGDRVVAVVGAVVGAIGVVARVLPSGVVRVEYDFAGKRVVVDSTPADLRLVERLVVNRRRRRYRVSPIEPSA